MQKEYYAKVGILALITLFIFSGHLLAQIITVPPEYEDRYESILEELRCLVCQNQTLADSSAGLAGDLRIEVKEMLIQGKSDQEILDFMSDRYGDFVLYNPPVKLYTLLLWFAPFLLLLVGMVSVLLLIKKRAKKEQNNSLDGQDKKRLHDLLENN